MGRTARKRKAKKNVEFGTVLLNTEPDLINLKKWMHFNGWKNETGLIPAEFNNTARGLTTKKRILKDEILIEIPFRTLVSPLTLQFVPIFDELVPGWKITVHEALAVFLLHERHLGLGSRWVYYLRTLPTTFQNCTELTDIEIRFCPEFLREPLTVQRKKFDDSYVNVKGAFDGSLNFKNIFTREHYTWAYWAVNSRSVFVSPNILEKHFRNITSDNILPLALDPSVMSVSKIKNGDFLSDQPQMALAPFLDLFNHSSDGITTAKIVESHKATYRLSSDSEMSPYNEVFISYGPNSNLKLLLEYGFILEDNKYDQINLEFEDILKILFIKLHNYQKDVLSYILDLENGLFITREGFSYTAKQLFLLLTLSESEWESHAYNDDFNENEFIEIFQIGKVVLIEMLDRFEEYKEQLCISTMFVQPTKYYQTCIAYINESLQLLRDVFELFQ